MRFGGKLETMELGTRELGLGWMRLQNKTPQTPVRVLGRSLNSPPPSTAQGQGKTELGTWEWHRRAIERHERGRSSESDSRGNYGRQLPRVGRIRLRHARAGGIEVVIKMTSR